MRSRAELERARRHFREVLRKSWDDDRRHPGGGNPLHLVTIGTVIDALSWVIDDGAPHIGPMPFGDLVNQLDAAEGNTPN